MEFKIENTEVYGLNKSIIASGNPMRTKMSDNTAEYTEKDLSRMELLGNTKVGEGHDQALTGIIVQFDLYAPLYQWKEIQRYHFLDFVSSQSTMHRLAKFQVKDQCVSDTDPEILERYQVLLDQYNAMPDENNGSNANGSNAADSKKALWRVLVASLPCGFVLGATMTTNYRQLKTIYNQRKHHKLREWHEFCDWCDTLPLFKELCLGTDTEK